jgi:ribosomal protein S18 acetylase RimI-like enzyme
MRSRDTPQTKQTEVSVCTPVNTRSFSVRRKALEAPEPLDNVTVKRAKTRPDLDDLIELDKRIVHHPRRPAAERNAMPGELTKLEGYSAWALRDKTSGVVVSLALFWLDDPRPGVVHLALIETDVDARGNGYGEFLLRTCLRFFWAQGMESCTLQPLNARVREWYKRLGFVPQDPKKMVFVFPAQVCLS